MDLFLGCITLGRCANDPIGYVPDRANAHASRFARRNSKLFRSANLRACVTSFLREGWSPEQIAGCLKLENSPIKVSHQTIYKFVYSKDGIKEKLPVLLARRKQKRTKWYSRKPRKSHIPDSAAIKHRPSSINKPKTIGHWEGDLVVLGPFRSANVTTIVERKSRFAHLAYNSNKST